MAEVGPADMQLKAKAKLQTVIGSTSKHDICYNTLILLPIFFYNGKSNCAEKLLEPTVFNF